MTFSNTFWNEGRISRRVYLTATAIVVCVVVCLNWISDPIFSRATIVAVVCLALWLSEIVPVSIPTFILWALTPLLLARFGDQFQLTRVLAWSANPVLVLFLGGFALSVAARRHGIDNLMATLAVRLSHGSKFWLLASTMSATALLSMWMSNIAAAAMMVAALHPFLAETSKQDPFRRALLMGIAISANLGGMATPIGTGPNGIAIASVSQAREITFTGWMIFALPLTLGLLLAALGLLVMRFKVKGRTELFEDTSVRVPNTRGRMVMLIFLLTVVTWLTEPFHGIPAAVIALLTTSVLFGSRLLTPADLSTIDWSTLILIAGGIGLGNLLEQSGVIPVAAASIPWQEVPQVAQILIFCFASALLSALMSNTAAVTILIPLSLGINGSPSTAIVIAIAASLGIPFAISTPPNAMVYGEGGLTVSDLAIPGLILMIFGCLVVGLTGPQVLSFLNIP